MARKTRVVHKPEERERLIREAAAILKTSIIKPSMLTLFERAQNAALTPDRHQSINPISAKWLMGEAQRFLASYKPAPLPPPPPAPAPKTNRDLIHEIVDQILDRQEKNNTAIFEELKGIKAMVTQFQGLLTQILGDLSSYSPDIPKTTEKTEDKRPRILVVGPIANQGNVIRDKTKKVAIVQIIENEKHANLSAYKNFDYAIVTRHARHWHFDQVTNALGRDRVVRLPTGGVDRTTEAVERLAKVGPNLPHGTNAYMVVNNGTKAE